MLKKIIYLFAFIFLLSSFTFSQEKYFLDENIDYSIKPADDFFNFANGAFIKRNPIPPSESTYGIFNLVEDSVYEYLRKICVEASNDNSALKGSNTQKIGDFFYSGLDTEKIEKKGIEPLKKWLKKIDKIKDINDVLKVIADMHTFGMSPLFSPAIGQDLMQSSVYKVYLYQGGIGLPDRDYYFNDDTRTKNIREKYVQHLSKMMNLLGSDGKSVSKNLIKLETDLAKASRKLEDLRDNYAKYNKMTLKEFSNLTP